MDDPLNQEPQEYNVHAYAVVRFKHEGITAESQADAISGFDWQALNRFEGTHEGMRFEFADDIQGYLVDEAGDEEQERTQYWVKRQDDYRPISFPGTDTALLREIHGIMSGNEWSPDTCEAIAEILTRAGFVIRDPNEIQEPEEVAA